MSRSISPAVGARLEELVHASYRGRTRDLPFHGWPHIAFVRQKGTEFAPYIDADPSLVDAAALTHDVNYLVHIGSEPEAGTRFRQSLLEAAGVDAAARRQIEGIVREANIHTRGTALTREGMALSDADTLFKALPVTPVALSCLFRQENNLSLRELADTIVADQPRLIAEGAYFYIPEVEASYGRWAATNVTLWEQVAESLADGAVVQLLAALGMGTDAPCADPT